MEDPRVYLIQVALREKGFYRGPMSGIEGPLTREAFEAWQKSIAAAPAQSFEEVVATWGLRFFSASELLTKGGAHARNGLNTDPPAALWNNIRPVITAADEVRRRLGSGIIITSAYRSDAYNRAIGGAANSYHKQFRALDLIPIGATVARLHQVCREVRAEGKFPGIQGIGRYNTFCHIDNGPRRDF
jgi:peptidoglycan hydrolase-like protein with peptidoglycan-binding domain